MNQPLEALMQAWQDLTEERKQAITTAIRREHKFLYKKWIDGIKHGFSPDFFAKRTNAIARDRLDRELFRKGAGDFAKEMLITYFTTTNRQINRLWLESFSTAAQNEPKNSSRELAESCLASLRVQAVDQDLVDLYAATLRYSCPHWFVDEPPDRTAIDESLSRSAPPSSVESGINRAASHTLVEVRDEHSGLLPEAKCQRQCVKTRTNNPPAREKPSAAKKSVLGTPSHARDEEERIRRVVQQESPKLGQRGGDDIQPDRILAVTHSLAEGISSLNFAAAREALRKVRTVFEPINDDIREVEELVRRIGKGINDLKFCQTLPPAVVSSVDVNAALIQSPSAAKISLQRVDTLVTRVEQAFRRWEALIKHVPTAFTTPSLDACVDLDSLAEMMEASCARMEMIIRDHADRLRRFSDFVAHITACEYSAAKRVLLDADSRTYTDSLWLVLNHPATNDLLNDQDTDLDVSAMLGAIKSDIEILSLLIALAWDADSTASMSLLKEAGPSILGDGPEENATLQFIRTADLFRLCQEIPELIPSALSQAVVSSLYSSQQDRMNLALRISQLPGIDPVCRGFCMQMSAHMAVHGVAKTISDMRQELFTGSDYEESRAIARSRVEEAINAPIGQHRNFHRLREIAHELYLFPLLSIVQRGSAKETMERWQADGDCAFKAQHCASKLSGPRKIENQHIINTKRYLESFEEKLRDWCRAVSMPSEDPHTLTLQSETAALVQQSKSNSRCAQHLVRSLKAHCVELADDEGKIICVSFRTDSGGAVGACLKPWRLESWIESSNNAEGDTSLQALLFDLLNEKAGYRVDQSEVALVRLFMEREEIRAAAKLADQSTEAMTVFDRLIAERRCRTVGEYESVLADAKEIQYRDESVQIWMEEVDRLLSAYSYRQASEALNELAAAVKEFHEKTEGTYEALVVWLREAGETVSTNATIQDLEKKAVDIRSQAAPRRIHIEYLTKGTAHRQLPESLLSLCDAVGKTLDTPVLWPTTQQSQDMAWAIEAILGYVERRWTSSAKTTVLTASLCSHLHDWLRLRLQMVGTGDPSIVQNSLSQITTLALGISADGWETTQVLDHMGAIHTYTPQVLSPEQFNTLESRAIAQQPTTTKTEVESNTNQAPVLTMTRVIADCRKRAAALTEGMVRISLPDDKLRAKCKEKDWDAVLSASLAAVDREEPLEHALSSYEVVAAAALYQLTRNASERFNRRDICAVAVMAISYALLLNDRSESYYFFSKDDLEQSIINALGCALLSRDQQGDDNKALRTSLAVRLSEMWEGKATEPDYLWLQQILSSARHINVPNRPRTCASVITDVLWGAFTGLDVDVAQPRHKLLLLAYKMRLVDEVVRHLAQEHAKPLDHHVVQFVNAVQLAEANPAAWDEARRLAQSFVEQVPPRAMKPWRLFVDTLNRMVKLDVTEHVCSASLENYVFEPDGKLMLELRLSPSAYNFPSNLTLELQCAAGTMKKDTMRRDLTDGDVLAYERIVRVGVPVDKDECDAVIMLGYRLVGTTTQNDPIDIRGEWRVEKAIGRHQPLPPALVARAWKGRDGKPVDRSTNLFHGRQKEQGDIDKVLSGEGGVQGSAMIIGQRRIGKTSLLWEVQAQHPPREGHVCGVFIDFSGISKKTPDEPLSRTFFRALTTLEDAGGRNRAFNDNFKTKPGNEWNSKLCRGLDPVTSLSSALTRFVDRIGEHTNGKVSRVAFFIDEFQSVFKFDRKQVDEVMWALRPVVQMSPSISLILAGSGLTRELVRGYDQAFFGSITTISLRPFTLPADFDAVRDTLLPVEVRQQLCPPGRDLDRLVQCAFDLCKGHPWFLSLLGYSAAQVLDGRPLSPALLNHVAREMIQGRVDFQDKETGAARFYGYNIFDTLETIGRRRGDVAKLILINVARQVTLDWPWLTAEQAIRSPMLQEVKVSEREALDALRLLRDEEVLEHQKGPQNIPLYRIRVPLIAEALKFDAADIAFDTVQDLKELVV